MSNKKYCYSTDGENYEGPFDSIEIAKDEGLYHGDHVYVGEVKDCTITDFMEFEGDCIFERMSEEAGELVGEHSLDWPDPSSDQVAELKELIESWATKNDLQPSFWGVGKVVEFNRIDGVVTRKEP